jgi:hypothetical protein
LVNLPPLYWGDALIRSRRAPEGSLPKVFDMEGLIGPVISLFFGA